MKIDIITCLPQLFKGPLDTSIVGRAIAKNLATIRIHNLRDYAEGKHKKVDDYPYGGGAGMLLKIEPIVKCIETLKSNTEYDEVIYMSPSGELLTQSIANSLSLSQNLIILCGHYKGIDERIRKHYITRELSIGEYVLSGGELPASVLIDSIIRLIPGVLSNGVSALEDTFQDDVIASPEYTRPYNFRGLKVPDVLMSGNEKMILKWKEEQSIDKLKKI